MSATAGMRALPAGRSGERTGTVTDVCDSLPDSLTLRCIKPPRVEFTEVLHLSRHFGISEDGADGASGFTGVTIDAGFRIDIAHAILCFEVNTVHWTDFDAGFVHHVDTGACYDKRHESELRCLPLSATVV